MKLPWHQGKKDSTINRVGFKLSLETDATCLGLKADTYLDKDAKILAQFHSLFLISKTPLYQRTPHQLLSHSLFVHFLHHTRGGASNQILGRPARQKNINFARGQINGLSSGKHYFLTFRADPDSTLQGPLACLVRCFQN